MSNALPTEYRAALENAGFRYVEFNEEADGPTLEHPVLYKLLDDPESSWCPIYITGGKIFITYGYADWEIPLDDKVVGNAMEFFIRLYTNNWSCTEAYMDCYPCERNVHKFGDHYAIVNGNKLEWEDA